MSFYRFDQVSGRLTPSQQFSAVSPQGLTPANKLKSPPEVRTNFPDMYRFRSTFNLAKQQVQHGSSISGGGSATGRAVSTLPTEFTATGFPKFPPGTKIGKKMVMGEFGPFSPKIRALQQLFQSNPDIPVYLKKGASDLFVHRAMLTWLAVQVFVLTPLGLWVLVTPSGTAFYNRWVVGKK